MFYQFDDDMVSVDCDELNDSSICMGFINFSVLENVYKRFGFSVSSVEKCRETGSSFACTAEIFDDYTFVKVNAVNAGECDFFKSSFALFIKKNMIIIVSISDTSNILRDNFIRFQSRISVENISVEKLAYSFLEEMISAETKVLEDAEDEINHLEETVIKNKVDKDFNMKLLRMKKGLLTLRGYYDRLIDISEALQENDNEIFDIGSTAHFGILKDKALRLKESVDLLRDSVVHLWDAYQACLDMRLNQTMKVFTTVTTVFSPIAVIVGWYGMNFDFMPELHWRYGYAFAAGLCVLVVGVLYAVFKKKKWF